MLLEIMLAILTGILFGTFTGLTPGVHVNLISVILISISPALLGLTSPLVLCVFIISVATTHTFIDPIPAIFLGAPNEATALSVLPGHRLLLQGRGYEAVKLTVIGSLLCLIILIAIIPIILPFLPIVYSAVQPYIGYILVLVVIFMLSKEKGLRKMYWAFILFLMSGILGLEVFSIHSLNQPLLGMLSGLFGVSTLLMSLKDDVKIPNQLITEEIKVKKSNLIKALGAATISGSITGLFPGIGAAIAALISMQLVGQIEIYSFLVLIGGDSTSHFSI